ncbi:MULTISPECIES: CaiB/BaiF CoA transferase family protein [unclassified Archaeoglobus]|uniref:CaiB/BaiF CoA transferase family protein n=1 Tax=unclassified Archaeoglobus TaxID=2643606 RepID=UPI0025C44F1F|nr:MULTISPECIES: CaiB/BaiF CoA-transferase family protein [unclassified Archaeoglobus]
MLEDVKVLEVAAFYPGPFCCRILQLLGAEVVKIEPPGGEPGRMLDAVFAAMNIGKKSVFLDLKSEEGLKEFMRLAERADVIVEGFRPGVAKKLGIGYDSVREVNEAIIYCSISAFGQQNNLAHLPAHDLNCLGLGGILEISAMGKEMRDPNLQLADFSSAVYAAIAILAALHERSKTGKGRYLDISMFHSALFSVPIHSSSILNGLGILPAFSSNPAYGIYRTKDGYITLGIIAEEHFWRRLCSALNLNLKYTLLESFSRFEEIRAAIQEKLENMTTDEAVELLQKADVPAFEVRSLKDVERIEEVVGEKLTEDIEWNGKRIRLIKPPFRW